MPHRAHRAAALDGHDAYELLGVPSSASTAQIRAGYLKAMRLVHPDRSGDDRRAKLVNCAHDLLLHDREDYDEYRRRLAARLSSEAGSVPAWVEDDWPSEPEIEEDPWGDADDGVGAPGQGADAPGAADHLPPPPGDTGADGADPDDVPYRPFAATAGTRAAGSGRTLSQPPILLLCVLIVALLMAVLIATIRGSSSANDGSALGSRGTGVSTGNPYLDPVSPYSYPENTYAAIPYPATSALPDPLSSALGVPPYPGSLLPTYNPLLTLRPGALADANRWSATHFCTVARNATLWCGPKAHGVEPVRRLGTRYWRSVTMGASHTCGIQWDRSLWCWGSNLLGEHGTGRKQDGSTVPQRVHGGGRWVSVAARDDRTCAVRTDHTLWCWGEGLFEDDLFAGLPDSTIPRRVGHDRTWLSTTAKGDRLCATRPSHRPQCWNV